MFKGQFDLTTIDRHRCVVTISDSFDLNEGFVDIFVPSVRPDDDYVVICESLDICEDEVEHSCGLHVAVYLGRMQSRGDMFQIMRRRN